MSDKQSKWVTSARLNINAQAVLGAEEQGGVLRLDIDQAQQERGTWLFNQDCTFMLSVAALKQLPDPNLPEVAFIGRSNVGKSSLINALVGRRSLARTSNTPGRTQQLNFFDLAGQLRLVDLPGYGFAKAPKEIVDQWNVLINRYLQGRPNLERVFVLIDSRHGLKESDLGMMKQLDKAAVPYQVILTKIDKITPKRCEELLRKTLEGIAKNPAAFPEVLATSSEKRIGFQALKAQIAYFLPAAQTQN